MLAFSFLIVFPALLIAAAVSDLLTMTIPNRISLLLVGGFAVGGPRCRVHGRADPSQPRRRFDRPRVRLHGLRARLGRWRRRKARRGRFPLARASRHLRVSSARDHRGRTSHHRPLGDAQHSRARFRAGLGLAHTTARPQDRRTLWHSARRSRPAPLSAHAALAGRFLAQGW